MFTQKPTSRKHVGVLANTGTRIAIAMLQIPDSPLRALIIDMDALPPYYEELLRNVLVSQAAQDAHCLADVLGATNVPGVGRSLMMEFHKHKLMRAESIDNVILTPTQDSKFKLRDVLASVGKLGVGAAMLGQSQEATAPAAPLSPQQTARILLQEATQLEADASEKRAQAYLLAPELMAVREVIPQEVATTGFITTDTAAS